MANSFKIGHAVLADAKESFLDEMCSFLKDFEREVFHRFDQKNVNVVFEILRLVSQFINNFISVFPINFGLSWY